MVEFATRLRQLRKDKHLTQAQVASRIGVTPSMVSSYETDIRLPSLYNKVSRTKGNSML